MLYESGDVVRDYDAERGLDFSLAFQLVPLDLTGCTAVMKITGLADLTMTVTSDTIGAIPQATLAAGAAAATTSGWTAGVYDYRVEVTFPGGQKWPFGRGKVVVL